MNLDPGMDPQLKLPSLENRQDALWAAHHVDVVQKGTQPFLWSQPKLESDERVVLSEGEQCWHWRVALFPAFALLHVMHCTFIIPPQICGWGPVKIA